MRKRYFFTICAISLAVVSSFIIVFDALAHLLYLSNEECDTLVVDVYGYLDNHILQEGVCYKRGLSVWEFRSLGKVKAHRVIIVTHFFSSPKSLGLGVSDDMSIVFLLLHPVTTFFVVKGVLGNGEIRLAVAPSIKYISSPMNNKTIFLVTCFRPEIAEFANAFLDLGARAVIVTRTAEMTLKDAVSTVYTLLKQQNLEELCGSPYIYCYR